MNLFIGPTCVSNTGLGLFVKEKGYKKGQLLPYTYEGVLVEYEKYDELNDYLVELTNQRMSIKEEDEYVADLAQKFDFHVKKKTLDERVDWDRVYDSFIAYHMEVNYETKEFVFWPCYDCQGKVHPDDRFNMFGLYMNEPPPYDYFYNTFDKRHGFGRAQLSKCNVQSFLNYETKTVEFRALCNIQPFDELIFFYGVFFNRPDYNINLQGISEVSLKRLRSTKDEWDEDCQSRFHDLERDRKRYKSDGIMFVRK